MKIQIETSSREPIYRQIVGQIREAVAKGRLVEAERLPSVRELSRELVVNPNTIAKAYTQLEREGVLNTRPGLGVFVAPNHSEMSEEARTQRLLKALDIFLTESVHLGFEREEVKRRFEAKLEDYQWMGSKSGGEREG